MRYKFRAYNKEIKKMVFLEPLQWPLKALEDEENWKVMMWTGLLDRVGKEIYEGDIVTGEEGFIGKVTGVCVYGGMAFHFKGKNDDNGEWFYTITNPNIIKDEYIEIIGNIYENGELL